MQTNPPEQLASIATISVSVFGIVAIAYFWHCGIVFDPNKIVELLDHIVQSPSLREIVVSIETIRGLIGSSSPRG